MSGNHFNNQRQPQNPNSYSHPQAEWSFAAIDPANNDMDNSQDHGHTGHRESTNTNTWTREPPSPREPTEPYFNDKNHYPPRGSTVLFLGDKGHAKRRYIIPPKPKAPEPETAAPAATSNPFRSSRNNNNNRGHESPGWGGQQTTGWVANRPQDNRLNLPCMTPRDGVRHRQALLVSIQSPTPTLPATHRLIWLPVNECLQMTRRLNGGSSVMLLLPRSLRIPRMTVGAVGEDRSDSLWG